MIKMISIILGGGVGSRLYPLTEQRSKPAVPIGGKFRLIDIPISNCLNSGVKRMFVVTQYNSASLNQHIKNTYSFDMFNYGFVDILAAEQTPKGQQWFQGTADAVRQCKKHFVNHDYDYVLILSGDQLYNMDFEAFAKHHIDQKADLSIATIPVNAKDAPSFGIMKVSKKGKIDSFIEKPRAELLSQWESPVTDKMKEQGRNYLASMGIYIFSKKALQDLLEGSPDATDFGKEIIPSAIQLGYTVASYQYDGYWTDIGNISSFFEANLALTDDNPEFNLFDKNNMIYTRPRMLAPSKIQGGEYSKVLITDGCFLQAEKIKHSIIGVRSKIGKGSVLKHTIMMGSDYYQRNELEEGAVPLGIGENCYIKKAILDKNCRVGNNVVICGDNSLEDAETESYCIKDGIVVLKKNCTIPDGARIGKVREKREKKDKNDKDKD